MDRTPIMNYPDPDDLCVQSDSSWYWECDECTAHGEAIDEEEAQAMWRVHVRASKRRQGEYENCSLILFNVAMAREGYRGPDQPPLL